MTLRNGIVLALACSLAFFPSAADAQAPYTQGQRYYDTSRTTPPSTAPATAPAKTVALEPEEIDQAVAPVALYPDSLLAQVLMASTYPLEVVQAERWVKQNPTLKGSADALNKLSWDPSVKSLIDFPQVLTMMSEKLDWTVKLGDAFIADQKAVMDAVQRLRNKAYAQGNLKTSDEQKVSVQPTTAPAAAQAPQVIVIESSSPSTVYVPTYNPNVVYGAWPYPAYPPYYYYPPGYVAGTAMISFGIGVACGAAWGHAWGDCDWNGGDIEVDIDKNVNFNGNIDRDKYKAERDARQTERQGSRDTRQADRQGARQGEKGRSSFQHDPSHRQGVAYRDRATTERFRGSNASQTTAQARDAYRGRAEAGRQDISRGAADAYRGSGGGSRTGSGSFGSGASGTRQPTAQSRDYSGTRSSGFSGASSSGASARAASNRGQTSRSSSSYSGGSRSGYSSGSRSGGYSGGGSRASGGSRAGGGARGGGRR